MQFAQVLDDKEGIFSGEAEVGLIYVQLLNLSSRPRQEKELSLQK